jgi:glycosyltransferase involved in cell wall biosynthesis
MRRPYVIVAPDFVQTGGMDRANYALACHLARNGHETHLVSFRVAPELAAESNVRVHLARRPGGKNSLGGPFLGARGAIEALRAGSRFESSASTAQLIANGGNCLLPGAANWVHYVHAADARARRGGLRVKNLVAQTTERIALRGARIVLANSERTRKDLVQYVGVDDTRIRVVYLGVDANDFRPRTVAEQMAIRAELDWPADRLQALFIGALGDERKGFATLYAAWKSLCRSSDWDVDLVAVGVGRQVETFRERARADGLGARMTFLGFRSDVPQLVGASDLLVAPSIYEPYGLAVHEALSSAVPAITSARCGVAEMYPDALTGWLLPDPKDDVDLASRLRRWREQARVTPPELRALSDRLRARDWSVVAEDIVRVCEA